MAIIFPHEVRTWVDGFEGYIHIGQENKGKEKSVVLTVRQFREIWNHEKHLIAEALGEDEKS